MNFHMILYGLIRLLYDLILFYMILYDFYMIVGGVADFSDVPFFLILTFPLDCERSTGNWNVQPEIRIVSGTFEEK